MWNLSYFFPDPTKGQRRAAMPLTDDQLRDLQIVERVASGFSLLGIATIITTFCLSKHYRNPIHRLILFNSFFNLFDAIATMISLSGPRAGNGSALCQFQGFLMQMYACPSETVRAIINNL